MVQYGLARRGDESISTDTTLDEKVLSWNTLTVESGVTLTVPHDSELYVADVMTVNGIISVQSGLSGPNGGHAGGSVAIQAFELAGSGSIQADGVAGVNQDTSLTDGAPIEVENANISPSASTSGATGESTSAPGGTPGDPLHRYARLYVEDWLISGSTISQQANQTAYAATGGGGGPANSNDYNGSGGAGGSCGGIGGAGGDGTGFSAEDGGVGGGAGGVIVVTTENLTTSNLTLQATGGDGGSGGPDGGDGGGGGGGGGAVYMLTDVKPNSLTYTLSGGTAVNGGTDGDPGYVQYYSLDKLPI